MTNFVYDGTALPATKSDRFPPINPTQQWSAADAAAVFSALSDIRTAINGTALNVKAYGAVGDGVSDDSTAINAAIAAAAATTSGAFGAIVDLPKGTYRCSSQIVGSNGVILRGPGFGIATIKASNTFSATSLVTNATHDGTQEFFGLQGLQIDGNQAGGAVCSVAVVDMVSLFVNSYVRDVIIVNGSNVGLRVAAAGTPGGSGPLLFENVWVANCIGHNVLIEEVAGNSGAFNGIYFNHLISEHQGSGKSALYLKGLGSAAGWMFNNLHIEMGQALATTQTGITVDGVADVLFNDVQLLTGSIPAITAGITITTAVQNVGIEFRRITNSNLINPVLSDLKNSVTIGAVNVRQYATADLAFRGAPRFLPETTTGAKSLVAQSSAGVDRAWFDDLGQLTGASFNGAGLDVVGDATNDRPLALINHAKSRVFAWYYPDASNLRFRYFTGGLDCLNFDSSAAMFVYGTSTFQFLSTFQSGTKGAGTRAAAPSTGTHTAGEMVNNADPIAGGKAGWICVTGGTPGTWKAYGGIDP